MNSLPSVTPQQDLGGVVGSVGTMLRVGTLLGVRVLPGVENFSSVDSLG